MYEGHRRVDSHGQQYRAESDAGIAGHALRSLADRDAPINQKQPDAIRQMPNGRRDPDHIDDKNRDDAEFARDDLERLIRVMRDRHRIKSRNQTKAEIQHVKSNEEKQNYSGHSLDRVKPVAWIRIMQIVGPRFN